MTEQVLLGDPFDDATTMGPVNNEQVATKMDEHVADAVDRGACVVAGGERADGFPTDLYWQATILSDVPPDARVATEETFGPVAPVVAIDSLEEAIELTNASPYGLLAAIFTADLTADCVSPTGPQRLGQRQRVEQLLGGHLPFGGRAGTDSGIGRVGGFHVMHSSPNCKRWSSRPRRAQRTERISLLEGDHVVAGDRPRAVGLAVADRGQQARGAPAPAPTGWAAGR